MEPRQRKVRQLEQGRYLCEIVESSGYRALKELAEDMREERRVALEDSEKDAERNRGAIQSLRELFEAAEKSAAEWKEQK